MVLDHPHVSKRHCRIQIVEGKPEIVDLRSTNGTYLGEKRLPPHTPVPWKEFPTITVGSYVVTLEEKAPRSN
jgi:pSer/pThr/pTyr-binding forkhead associated (FHA) protein